MSDFILQLQLADHHRELMNTLQRGHQGNAALSAQHDQLIADYNQLAERFNTLQRHARHEKQQAEVRVAKLEERASNAESSAEHWRAKYSSLFKRTLPP